MICTRDSGFVFHQPEGIALNSAGTLAYISNHTGSTVFVCTINLAGGFDSCSNSGAGANAFSGPVGIAIR